MTRLTTQRIGFLGAALALSLGPNITADAATATANIIVTATVNNTCTLSVSAMTFDTFTTAATQDKAVDVTYTCTSGVVPVLYNGTNADSAGESTFYLKKAGDATKIVYMQILRDSTGDVLLGENDATGWSLPEANGSPSSVQIRGRAQTASTTVAGTFTSTIPLYIAYP